jgi:exodeoxyribonuclease VII large subunit
MIEAASPRVYRVSELNREIRSLLEEEIGTVWLEGEVSNLRQPSSGHLYFTLKDSQSQIAAVLFRGSRRGSPIELRDGLFIRAQGDLSVYERSGTVQLVIRQVQAAGLGALQEAFEKLKLKLQAEGLFDRPKRALPLLPNCIGLVTSPTGAAIRDIFQVAFRRFPGLHIVLAPVRVQGPGAGEEVAAAIDLFNEWGGADVLIVGRGGGSLEDLWAFNEEGVARAIARSRIPVISAVGHEIDTTISDWVADVRAPTPSAAAERVVARKDELDKRVRDASRALARLLRSHCLEARNRWAALSHNRVFHEPGALAGRQRERVAGLRHRGIRAAGGRLRQVQQTVDDTQLRLRKAAEWNRRRAGDTLGRLDAQLRALHPLAVMARGFSLTCLPDGHILRDAADAKPGLTLRSVLARGELDSKVTAIRVSTGEKPASTGRSPLKRETNHAGEEK